jgi:ABC-type nitrate/sulfonate/bicarbonate transport system substrate-binding protein
MIRRLLGVLTLGALFALVLLQPSCSSAKTPATVGGTPTGTYSLTVTATSGSFSQTKGVSLTVTP